MGQGILPFDRAFLPPSPICLRPAVAGRRRDVDWLSSARTQTGVNGAWKIVARYRSETVAGSHGLP